MIQFETDGDGDNFLLDENGRYLGKVDIDGSGVDIVAVRNELVAALNAKGEWTAIEDRLPPFANCYLVTLWINREQRPWLVGAATWNGNEWMRNGERTEDVIAYRPLPEPYFPQG